MKRREFIAGLVGAAAWPHAARAQQGDRVRRIGALITFEENDPELELRYSAFTQALADLGWTDGGNVRIDRRGGAAITPDRIRAFAQELVGQQPDILLAGSTPAIIALRRETPTIPIVFANVNDPVASGIVARLDRPSGNITGFAVGNPSMGGKWLELLLEIAPGLKRVVFMFNPDTAPVSLYMLSLEAAARSLAIVPTIAPVESDVEIETAINVLGRGPRGGLVVMPGIFYMGASHGDHIGSRPKQRTGSLLALCLGQRRRFALLRNRRGGQLASRRHLCGSHSARREGGGFTRSAANQVRARDQPQDRQGSRPYHSVEPARHRRRGDRMRRREFIAGLGGAAVWPLVARAQRTAIPVVGLVSPRAADRADDVVAGIHRGLAEMGFVEGRNLAVEYRWAGDRLERLPTLLNDLVQRPVALILTAGSVAAARAAKAATTSIPIVFLIGSDPVETGLVVSLNRPGGNLTGLALLNAAVVAKRLELLHEFVPRVTSIASFVNSTNSVSANAETRELQAAAHTLGLRLVVVNASYQSDFEMSFATIAREQAGAIVVSSDAVFREYADRLVALAAREQMPMIFAWREVAEAGGLMSYGTDFPNAWRQLGIYAGRVLKGDKPANLPVEQVTKMELVLNNRTAKALGITFPTSLLVRADEVIE